MRCTHRIWEEKNIGRCRTHYVEDCTLHTLAGPAVGAAVPSCREPSARLPGRSSARDVIWSEFPDERLYISHHITSQVTDMIATIFYGMLKVIRSTHNATRKALVARTEADPTALA